MNGETKNDFVNAAMRELKATGWMSNRMRQIVASYFIYDLDRFFNQKSSSLYIDTGTLYALYDAIRFRIGGEV